MADVSKLGHSLVWLLMLVFIGWPVAAFCAGWWVFLLPFEALFGFVREITDFLEKLMTWPRELGRAIVSGQSSFPKPW